MDKQTSLFYRLIREFLVIYLPEQKGFSEHTIKAYRISLNLLLEFLKEVHGYRLSDIKFDLITRETIEAFLDWLENTRTVSIETRNHRLSAIRSFFRYAGNKDLTLMTYLLEIEKVPIKKSQSQSQIKFFSEESLKIILEQPNLKSKKELRNLIYMILLYDTGARNQEILMLKLNDISMNSTPSVKLRGKGGKMRIVPIMERTVEHLRKYLDLYHPNSKEDEFLFYIDRKGLRQPMSPDNVAKFIKSYGLKAGKFDKGVPENLHPHMFRHARAMHLYKGGMPLPLISEWLGHANMETTLIYANADTEMKQKAIEKATSKINPLISTKVEIDWKNDEEVLKQLYGLS